MIKCCHLSRKVLRILDLKIKLKKVEARRKIDSETYFGLVWFGVLFYFMKIKEEDI